jgi:20S proteasome subunit alpha 3
MSSKYDSKTSIFSPEGRLLQVENAIKNIGNAGLCIGIVTNEGIILTCEKESISKLYERGRHSEKIYTIDRNIAVGVGGLAADANLLIDYSRRYSQSYFIKYKNLTPVEKLVKYVSDVMQTKPNLVVLVHMGLDFFLLDGTKILDFNFIILNRVVFIMPGKLML